MTLFRWDHDKNEWLKKNRGVSFEEIVLLLEKGQVLDIVEHPDLEKYPGQRIAILNIDGYAYLVPYVQQGEEIVLKTVIPSRKATVKYLGGSHEKDR